MWYGMSYLVEVYIVANCNTPFSAVIKAVTFNIFTGRSLAEWMRGQMRNG
jgi:hypothetical protein